MPSKPNLKHPERYLFNQHNKFMPPTGSSIYDPLEVDANYYLDHLEEEDNFYHRARNLPETISDVLFSEETPQIIEQILNRYTLREQECIEVTRLIKATLIGDLSPTELTSEIMPTTGLDPEAGRQLGQEIIEKLLAPVLEELGTHALTTNTPTTPPSNPNNVINLRDQNR